MYEFSSVEDLEEMWRMVARCLDVVPPRSRSSSPPRLTDSILATNSLTLIDAVGSPYRSGARAIIGKDLPTATAAAVFNVSPRTIQRDKHVDVSTSPICARSVFAAHKLAMARIPKRVDEAEFSAIRTWLEIQFPARSGSKTGKPVQKCTDHELFAMYCASKEEIAEFAISTGSTTASIDHHRCQQWFNKLKRKIVERRRWYDGQFDCKHCLQLAVVQREQEAEERKQQRVADEKKEGKEMKEEVDVAAAAVTAGRARELVTLNHHVNVRNIQATHLQEVRAQLKEDELLIVSDFTVFDLHRNMGDKTGQKLVTDLVLVCETRVDGELVRVYRDFLCGNAGKQRNDVCYVYRAWETMVEQGILDGYKRIILFSDGGPKHFKNVYAMAAMLELRERWNTIRNDPSKHHPAPVIEWYFFASYHGHSLADSHAGKIMMAFHAACQAGKRPADDVALGALIEVALSHTHVTVLPLIPRPKVRRDLSSLADGTKKWHVFVFIDGKGVLCREHAESEDPYVLQTVVTKLPKATATSITSTSSSSSSSSSSVATATATEASTATSTRGRSRKRKAPKAKAKAKAKPTPRAAKPPAVHHSSRPQRKAAAGASRATAAAAKASTTPRPKRRALSSF